MRVKIRVIQQKNTDPNKKQKTRRFQNKQARHSGDTGNKHGDKQQTGQRHEEGQVNTAGETNQGGENTNHDVIVSDSASFHTETLPHPEGGTQS